MILALPKTRNREPLKPVDDFDRCAIRNKIHEFYTVRRQLPSIQQLIVKTVDHLNRLFKCKQHYYE
jgi:hypothetical protein